MPNKVKQKFNRAIAFTMAFLLMLGSFLVPGLNPMVTPEVNASERSEREASFVSELVKSDKEFVSVTDYLIKHLDKSMTGEVKELVEMAPMVSKVQVMDRTKGIKDTDTIDSTMTNGVDPLAMTNFVQSFTKLYDVNPESKYLVAVVDTNIKEAGHKTVDSQFARFNYNGEDLKDVKFDYETGLVYIAKSEVLEAYGKGEMVQVQRMTIVDNGAETPKTIDVNINGKSHVIKTKHTSQATTFNFVTPEEANKIKLSSLKVMFNGEDMTDSLVFLNRETGNLTVELSPSALSNLEISYENKTFLDDVKNVFMPDTEANVVSFASMRVVNPNAPYKLSASASAAFKASLGSSGNITNMVWRGELVAGNIKDEIFRRYSYTHPNRDNNGFYVSSSDASEFKNLAYLWTDHANRIHSQTGAPVGPDNYWNFVRNNNNILPGSTDALWAAHEVWNSKNGATSYNYVIDVSSFNLLTDSNGQKLFTNSLSAAQLNMSSQYLWLICTHPTVKAANDGQESFYDGRVRFAARVTETSLDANGTTGYMTLALSSEVFGTQAMAGMIKIRIELTPTAGFAQIKKVNEGGQPLAGARFGFYAKGSTAALEVVTTNAQGMAVTSQAYKMGEYYFKEVQAPNGYDLVATQYPVTIGTSNTTTATAALAGPTTGVVNRRSVGSLELNKTTQRSDNLMNIKFNLYSTNNNGTLSGLVKSGTTNNAGLLSITNIPTGTYYLQEDQAQATHVQVSNTIYTVTIASGQVSRPAGGNTITPQGQLTNAVTNVQPEATLTVRKAELQGRAGQIVDGAQFKIRIDNVAAAIKQSDRRLSGTYVRNGASDLVINVGSAGKTITTPSLPVGTYSIVETNSGVAGIPANTGHIKFEVVNITSPTGQKGARVNIIENTTGAKALENQNAWRAQNGLPALAAPANLGNDVFVNASRPGFIKVIKENTGGVKLANAVFEVLGANDAVVDTITSNAQGIAVSRELPFGTYKVREKQAPVGYDLNNKVETVTISENANPLVTFTFQNEERKISFNIVKKDVEKGVPANEFDGVKFTLKPISLVAAGLNQAPVEITVVNGEAVSPQLPLGIYEVTETFLPEELANKYELNTGKITIDATGAQAVVKQNADATPMNDTISVALQSLNTNLAALGDSKVAQTTLQAAERVFANRPKYGIIKIEKVDKDTQAVLPGAVFRVSGGPGNYFSKEYTTDASGIIQTEALRVGSYRVEEIKAPKGYAFDNGVAFNEVVEVSANANANEVVKSHKQYKLVSNQRKEVEVEIFKENLLGPDAYMASYEGAEYELRAIRIDYANSGIANGEVIKTLVTDANGKLALGKLGAGLYELREIKAPTGFSLNRNPINIEVTGDDNPAVITAVATKDARANRDALESLLDMLRETLTNVWNEQKGQATYTDKELGLEVLDQANFDKVGEKYVGDIAELVKLGRVVIDKKYTSTWPGEAGVGEANVEFGVYRFKDGVKGEKVDTLITNKDGLASSKYLPFGDYLLVQESTPHANINKVEDAKFSIKEQGDIINFKLENEPAQMKLHLTKKDAHTGEVIEKEGIVFSVYAAEDINDPYTGKLRYAKDSIINFIKQPATFETTQELVTDAQGQTISFSALPAGKYYLKEVKAPEGYFVAEDAKFEFEIPNQAQLEAGTVTTITITLPNGATEEMVDKNVENTPQYGEIIIEKHGEQFTGFEAKIKSVKAQEAETVEKTEVKVPQADVKLVLESTVMEEVEKQVPVAEGSDEMKLEKVQEEVVKLENVETDAAGKFEREVTAGKYRVLSQDGSEILALEVTEKDIIKVQLEDKVETSEKYVEGKLINKSYDINKAIYEDKPLAGAKFEVIAKEDIKSYDGKTEFYKAGDKLLFAKEDVSINGKVVYKKGDAISAPALTPELKAKAEPFVVTTSEAQTILSRIPLGKYEVVEVAAPIGFKLDENRNAVEFTPKVQTVEIVKSAPLQVENERQILSFKLTKELAAKMFDEGQSVENVVFGLFTADVVNSLAKDTLVDVANPTADGTVLFADIPAGNYYVKELSTVNGYILDETEYQITTAHTENSSEDIVTEKEEVVENKPSEMTIKLVKVDAHTDKPLAGVKFKLYKIGNDGIKTPVVNQDKEFFETDENGAIVVEKLNEGSYVWEEFEGLNGYVIENKTIQIAVSEDANLEVKVGNDPTEMSFNKIDSDTGKPVIGAVLSLQDAEGNVLKLNAEGYISSEGTDARWMTDGSAKVIKGLTVGGNYKLVEEAAPEGYVLAKPIEFTVSNSKGVQLIAMENKLTTIKIVKKDMSDRTTDVFGAVLELHEVKEDGTTAIVVDRTNNRPVRFRTAEAIKDGYVVKGLVPGKAYVVIEAQVAEGYLAPVKNLEIIAMATEEVQTFVVYNEPKPSIGTSAAYVDGFKENQPSESVTIVDVVTYEKLIPGEAYKLVAKLVNGDNPEQVVAEKELTFVPESANGSVEVPFEGVNTSELSGTRLVAFEKLYRLGRGEDAPTVAEHEDPNDPGQSVYVPKVGTTATDKVDGAHDALAGESVTIVDVVKYEKLVPGVEYTVNGTLMDKETGKEMLVNDKPITSTKTFVASASGNGEVALEFTFDASLLAGKTVVAFEEVLRDGKVIAIHKDINDPEQTVFIPKVGTEASNKEDGSKEISPEQESVVVVDIVKYENLIPGTEYTVKGKLVDSEDPTVVLAENEVKFTPEAPNGQVELELTFSPKGLNGKNLVVFERVFNANGKLVGIHEDPTDPGQTVHIPDLNTNASLEGAKEEDKDLTITIIDLVTYTNLIVGKEYEVKGKLMDKETGKEVLVNGSPVTAETKFTPTEKDGSLELAFTLPLEAVKGKTIVVFETLLREGREVVVHHDINDEDQTVEIPSVKTTATSGGKKQANPTETVTIVDRVDYTGLIVGKEYEVKGILMDKSTNAPLVDKDGKTFTATAKFTAEASEGFIDLVFNVPGELVRGKTLVVFETLLREGKVVGVHHDINDEAQTVEVTDPKVGTTANVNGGKEAEASSKLTIVDRVEYKNLVVGREYIVRGILMDKATNAPLLVGGKQVTAEKSFIAESANGFVDLTFEFDGSSLGDKEIVVFERLYQVAVDAEGKPILDENGNKVYEFVESHEDINDEAQTVRIKKPRTPKKVVTSDETMVIASVIPVALAALAGAGFFAVSKKRKNDEE